MADDVVSWANDVDSGGDDSAQRAELLFRLDCLEHRLANVECWLAEVASDLLDRTSIDGIPQELDIAGCRYDE